MGHTFLCVLQFFLLNTLFHCGHAEDAVLTLEPNWSRYFTGESVTFTCDMKEGENTDWEISFTKDGREIQRYHSTLILQPLHTGHSGGYQCSGRHIWTNDEKVSNTITLSVSYPPKPRLTAGPSTITVGGSVTLSCSMDDSEGWKYDWYRERLYLPVTSTAGGDNREIRVSQGGVYTCVGRREPAVYTYLSDDVTVDITYSNSVSVSLQLDWTQMIRGDITVRCEIQGGGDTQWVYEWKTPSEATRTQRTDTKYWTVRESEFSSGGYRCRGTNTRDSYSATQWSEAAALTVSDAVLTLDPSRSSYFTGESVTFTCDMKDNKHTDWETRLIKDGGEISSHTRHTIKPLSTGDSGRFQCFGLHKTTNYIKTSESIYLTVSEKPKAQLRADDRVIPVGGSVTLSCSVTSSTGWKYYWYRGDKSSEVLNTQDCETSVSQEGLYWCRGGRGGRGDAVYYTQYSDSVRINRNVGNKVVVTLHPNWTQLFRGDTITVRCEIEDTGDTEWEYEWKTPTSIKPQHNEFNISSASPSFSGGYKCRGRMRNAQHITTEWSQSISLTVSHNKAQCVLRASPSWLSPGASVALKCEVEPPSAGWRFYWYQTVPDGSHSYRYELLPASDHGTEQGSYMVHGQTHTAGYVCRAGRGEPAYYTDYSKAAFVWSGDVGPSASLTVSPDRVQHFTSDSVSLSCEGNSAEWRVRRFPEGGFLSSCSNWTTTGSRCDINTAQSGSAVFWCESGSGHFSNSLNITVHGGDIILVSPVLPVTQGTAVTLGCRSRTQRVVSTVFFYQNDQLIQNDTRAELNISAASESHQGFYSCEVKQQSSRTLTSAKSWMSVKPEASFSVLFIIGVVCKISLVILSLLLCCYIKSTGSCSISRCQRTNQSSATGHVTNQEQPPHSTYASLLHGDSSVYESSRRPGDTGNGSVCTR